MKRPQIFFIFAVLILIAIFFIKGIPAPARSSSPTDPAPASSTSAATPPQSASPTPTPLPATEENAPLTNTPLPIPTLPPRDASAPTLTPLPPLTAAEWRDWPVIPALPEHILEIAQQGLALGADPTHFSVIGDCQSVPLVFMGNFDQRPEFWPTYDYTNLLPTLTHFQGSFGRRSGAVANGMSAASLFSPMWADLNICTAGDTPLECEFKLQHPAIVFINLGTNYGKPEQHAEYLRDILDFVIAQGAIPILSTKGDNAEGDWSINEVIAEVALEYDLPLWNFWAAIQDLPNHGIDEARPEGNYLTRTAWDVRSITGLQMLDVIWHAIQPIYEPSTGQSQ
ncbi:MAG: hypothetical protein H6636_09940 [Anaerolineales bacterium]|nr:hypothetical protein [Anaerolineales bacterium]